MDNVFKESLIIKFAIAAAILIVFRLVRSFNKKQINSKIPLGKERQELIREAKELKAGGLSYQERIHHFRNKGLNKKVVEKIIILAEDE